MAYLVKIFARAERNLADLYGKVDAANSDAASRWYEGLRDAILSLEAHPNRCALTSEKAELRHLLYGSKPHVYRVIFRVAEKQKRVEVLHIRHGARREIKASDLI
jgi:plasmid stabilization system protein ParE